MLTALSLLDALSFPAAALILGICILRAVSALALVAETWVQCADRCCNTLARTATGMLDYLVVQRSRNDRLADTSERALITLIGSAGGIPGSPEDKVTRQLVREIREMYEELERPTIAVKLGSRQQRPVPDAEEDLDERDLSDDDNDDQGEEIG